MSYLSSNLDFPLRRQQLCLPCRCISGLALDPTLPTEDSSEEVGVKFEELSRERGATTGRKADVVGVDLAVVKSSTAINHYLTWTITKLNVSNNFPTLEVAIAYKGQPRLDNRRYLRQEMMDVNGMMSRRVDLGYFLQYRNHSER